MNKDIFWASETKHHCKSLYHHTIRVTKRYTFTIEVLILWTTINFFEHDFIIISSSQFYIILHPIWDRWYVIFLRRRHHTIFCLSIFFCATENSWKINFSFVMYYLWVQQLRKTATTAKTVQPFLLHAIAIWHQNDYSNGGKIWFFLDIRFVS